MLIKLVVKSIKKYGLTDAKQAYITNLFKLCRYTVNLFKGIFISALMLYAIFMITGYGFEYACMVFFLTMIIGAVVMFSIAGVSHITLYLKYQKAKKEIEGVD